MRASDLSLVISTGYCLLRAVRAALSAPDSPVQGPSSAGIVPSILTPDQPYRVTWDGCTSPCFIAGVTLLEIVPPNFLTATTQILPLQTGIADICNESINNGQNCATTAAPSSLNITNTYEIVLAWQTVPGTSQIYTTGTPLSIFNATAVSGAPHQPTSSTVTPSGSFGRSVAPTPTSTATPTSAIGTNTAGSPSSSDSSGLSTGAKVGIAIGAVGFALLVLIAVLLIWRRSRQRQLRALPNGMPYSHEIGSTNRDLTAEKEINVINSPVDTLNNGYSSMPPVAQTQSRSQTDSWAHPDEHTAAGAAPTGAPYADAHRRSNGSGYEDLALPVQDSQPHMPPVAAAGPAIQRKPVGAVSGPTQHLREPGMSDEEVARLEEEERRLDEAIAEAERRRQQQG